MSTLKVDAIRHNNATSDAITTAADGTCTAKITNDLSNRNLIVNGGCSVNQYGSSSTSNGIKTLDRWYASWSGTSTAITQTAHDLTSSDTGPWEQGFKRSFHLARTAGSPGDADNYANIRYLVEAQDVVNSGWLHTSTSSKMTLSFWVKSSLAGTYGVTVRTKDGTNKVYATTYTLSADTWKKVSMTFPGASNITLNNDNGAGFDINIAAHWGTDFTVSSGFSYETWNTFVGSSRYNNFPQNWVGTANATFEATGLQLEAGDHDTDFEHRSYGDELLRCQRYYEVIRMSTGTAMFHASGNSTIGFSNHWWYKAEKRIGTPTISIVNNATFKDDSNNNRTLTGMFTSPDHVMFYNANSNGGSFRLFNTNQVISVTSSAEL